MCSAIGERQMLPVQTKVTRYGIPKSLRRPPTLPEQGRRPPSACGSVRHGGQRVDDAVAVEAVVALRALTSVRGGHRLVRPVGLLDLAGVGERARRRAGVLGGRALQDRLGTV